MAKRMILMVALMAVIHRGSRIREVQAVPGDGGQFAALQPPPEAVTTIVAQRERVAGHAERDRHGRRGAGRHRQRRPAGHRRSRSPSSRAGRCAKGDVLVQLDTRQEQAQLAAAEAQRELARLNFERMQGLRRARASISRAEYDRAAAEQKQAEAQVGEIRATIERKTIRAPFSGVLGIRQVNLGQYLAGGDPVVPLQSLNPIYVNFGVPQQDAGADAVGRHGAHHRRRARRRRRSPGASPRSTRSSTQATRNVQVQATLANPDGKLRPGMFVQTQVDARREHAIVIALPASAISYAPYGDSVFVVADLKDPNGQTLPRRAPAVREARARARRSGRGRSRASSRARRSSPRACSSCATARPCRSTTRCSLANNPAPKPEDS